MPRSAWRNCAPGDFALVVSASCSSEDLYVAQQVHPPGDALLRGPISAAARYGRGLGAAARLLALSQPLDALDSADLIFCLGLDATYAQSVVEPYLLRARARGAALLTLNAHQHVPGRFADVWLRPPAGEEAALLAELAAGQAGGGEVGAALRLLRAASRPLLLVGPAYLADLPQAVERLQAATGAGLVALAAEGNLAGALRLGFGEHRMRAARACFTWWGRPCRRGWSRRPLSFFKTRTCPPGGLPLALRDGLVLPMAAFCEAEGSLVDHAGALKHLSAAVAPPGEALPGWEIVCRIARAMGAPGFDFSSARQISAELAGQAAVTVQPDGAPGWLACPGEHDFLGAPLAAWVEGLRAPACRCRPDGRRDACSACWRIDRWCPTCTWRCWLRRMWPRLPSPGSSSSCAPAEESERIPLSISDWDARQGTVSVVYMIVGKTTAELAALPAGAQVATVAGPLGNPMELGQFGHVVCVGGCYGIASLYPVARALKQMGNRVTIVVEARSDYLLFWQPKLKAVCRPAGGDHARWVAGAGGAHQQPAGHPGQPARAGGPGDHQRLQLPDDARRRRRPARWASAPSSA